MALEESNNIADSTDFRSQEVKLAASPTSDPPRKRKRRLNGFSLAVSLLASTNSILLGYDIGVMSGAVLYIKDHLKISSVQQEILVGSLNVCSLIGSFASGKTSDLIGRRYTIVLSAATFLLGALLMGLAVNYVMLMAGRAVAGIGVGYSLMIAPVYTAEISPASTRGFLSSLPEVFINVGILLGFISNYVFADMSVKINWRLMLGIASLPAIGIMVGMTLMPESPRWLVMKGKHEEAKRVLIKTSGGEGEAEERLSEIMNSEDSRESQGAWQELIVRPSKPMKRILLSAIGINFFMQATGNDAVVYYSPEVFKKAGIHKRRYLFLVTVVMGIAKTSFVLLSALYLDNYGRRPMLMLGCTGQMISLVGLGLGSLFLERATKKPVWAIGLCIVAVCADVSFFSIGLGPITWVYSSEIFPSRLRAMGTSIAFSVNRVVSGAVAMSFLSISKKITFGGVFFVLGGIAAAACVFFYLFLPETKGKTLEEIGKIFEDKVKTRGDTEPNVADNTARSS